MLRIKNIVLPDLLDIMFMRNSIPSSEESVGKKAQTDFEAKQVTVKRKEQI